MQCCQKKVSREPYCLTSRQVLIPEPPTQPGGASSGVRPQPDICLSYRRQVPQRWEDKMAAVSHGTCAPDFQYSRNVPGYLVPPVTLTRLQVCLSSAFRWCHCTRTTSLHQNPCPTWVSFRSCWFMSIYSFVCLIPQCLNSNCTNPRQNLCCSLHIGFQKYRQNNIRACAGSPNVPLCQSPVNGHLAEF